MDWAAIEEARAFAERWHARGWSVARLPELLGARILAGEIDPIVMGATRRHGVKRLIYLHERLAGPAYVGVLAHECAHPFQAGTGTDYCSGPSGFHPREQVANVNASILAVPLAAVAEAHPDDGSIAAVADALCVPTQMIRVRRALAVVLGELPGRRDFALDTLGAACIGLSAYFWRLSSELTLTDDGRP